MARAKRVYTQRTINGHGRNGCVGVACTYALFGTKEGVEDLQAMNNVVEDRLRETGSYDHKNSWFGPCSRALAAVGVQFRTIKPNGRFVDNGWRSNWIYPTAAQFLRDHPEVKRACIHSQGHLAYVERDRRGQPVYFNCGPRYRVHVAYVLDD